jgi:uncharacterized protein (UPF0332 family)
VNESQKTLVRYRIEQSQESCLSARILFRNNMFRPAVNRAYYAMFYAVLALLVTRNQSISKHAGVISIFDREYVKRGVFDKNLSKNFHEAFDLRQRVDYTEMFDISKERAGKVICNAELFVAEIVDFLAEADVQ